MFHVDRRSLRVRLLTWLGGVALLVVGLTWLLHGVFLESLAKDFLGERLKREAAYAITQLEQDRLEAPAAQASTHQRYRVFHHLYVLRIDENVSASDPEGRRLLAPLLDEGGNGLIELMHGERHLLVYRHRFTWQGTKGVLLIGEDFSRIEAGLATLHRWVGGIAVGLLVVLVVLNMLAVNRGLRPLWQLRDQLEALQAGERQRLSLNVPAELDALVAQLNRFMDDIDLRLQRSRESVANLSHALKTPLATITQVLRGGRPIDDSRRRKLMMRIEDINAQLDAELRRARIAGPHAGRMTQLARDTKRLVDMFRGLYPQRTFQLTQATDARDQVPVDAHDFAEMLGIVLDNAGKWSTREVRCHIYTSLETLTLTVDDDGPGVAEQQLPQLGERGTRLDERYPGHGLGLAILMQLVARYEGHCHFARSPLGGLRVTTTLPLAGGQSV